MGWNVFGNFWKPKANSGVSSSYALFCQEIDTGAHLVIDSEATWFLDAHGQRGGVADLEKVIAGTANYHGVLSRQVEELGWLMPWEEYAFRNYKAAEIVQANSMGWWYLRGIRAEAGAIALFYRHKKRLGDICEILIGCDYTELHLAVQTSDAVRISVRGSEQVAPGRLTDAGALCRVGLTLKQEVVQPKNIGRLFASPYTKLETSIREVVSLEGASAPGRAPADSETFKFMGRRECR